MIWPISALNFLFSPKLRLGIEEVPETGAASSSLNMSIIPSNNNDEREETANIFKVDHSIRGTAKCKECKKQISKNELRIGKMVRFKEKTISILLSGKVRVCVI